MALPEQEMSVEIAAHVRTVSGLLVLPALGCFVSCAEDQFVQVLTYSHDCTPPFIGLETSAYACMC